MRWLAGSVLSSSLHGFMQGPGRGTLDGAQTGKGWVSSRCAMWGGGVAADLRNTYTRSVHGTFAANLTYLVAGRLLMKTLFFSRSGSREGEAA